MLISQLKVLRPREAGSLTLGHTAREKGWGPSQASRAPEPRVSLTKVPACPGSAPSLRCFWKVLGCGWAQQGGREVGSLCPDR